MLGHDAVVCATTRTTMSVTSAAAGGSAEKAAWPGGQKVTRCAFTAHMIGSMCWVMAALARGRRWCRESRSGLPWSTWPIMAHDGARAWAPRRRSRRTGDGLDVALRTRRTVCQSRQPARRCRFDDVVISSSARSQELMMSTPRRNRWKLRTVMKSGMTTSRTVRGVGGAPLRFSFSRPGAATEARDASVAVSPSPPRLDGRRHRAIGLAAGAADGLPASLNAGPASRLQRLA